MMTAWQVATSMGPLALGLGLVGVAWAMRRPKNVREESTAFTPSRFMTLAAYPLAIYAGYALWQLVLVLVQLFLCE